MKSCCARRLITLIVLFASLSVISIVKAQEDAAINLKEKPTRNAHGYYPESSARERAVKALMPSYPLKAAGEEGAGIIKVKVEIERATGSVIRAIVQPGSDLELRKAIYLAVKQWTFRPFVASYAAPEATIITKLTFSYAVKGGKGFMELYTPPSDTPPEQQLGSYFPRAELQEWMEWAKAN